MNLLRISNCYLTKGGSCGLSLMMMGPPIPTTRSTLQTPLAPLSTSCVLHRLDGQCFCCCRDLLRTHETKLEHAVHREGGTDDVDALRANLFETKLKLLATQLAYKELALRVGPCFCPADSTKHLSSINLRLQDILQQVQALVRSVPNSQRADQLLDDPGKPSLASSKNPPSDTCLRKDSTKASKPASEDEELDTVKLLMAAAHNGDASALTECRSLKRIAEYTSRSERSVVQKFLISKWTKPRPREIFVDASGHGIGVVLGDRWLAWKFVNDHPDLPKGPDGKINTCWAELIAAEMGVRTLIAAKYSDVSVSLRSDNDSVVAALKARKWKKFDSVVQRILALGDEVGLELRPDRVDGKDNPADELTRRIYPPREQIILHRPLIPSHLSELIQQVDCVE